MQINTCPPRRQRFIKVEFAPSSGCLGSIVALVTEFCRNVIDDSDIVFAFRMAAFELSENIVKYCSGDRAWLEVSVENGADGSEIVLTTSNQAQLDRLTDVSERLTAAETADDPVAHFDDLVRETLNSPTESRLGIGRLRAEADLELSHHTSGDWITISARRRILKMGTGGN